MPGYTRCAVLGRVHRLGLQMARTPSSPAGIQRAKYTRVPRTAVRETVAPPTASLPVGVEQPLPEARVATPPDDGSRLHLPAKGDVAEQIMALTAHTCRWPVGDVGGPDFHFCLEPIRAYGPYCAAHTKASVGHSSGGGWHSFR
jgi:GcrA cell cycle regulator